MTIEDHTISRNEAAHEIALTSRRIALLHLAYAKMLVEEFGKDRGIALITKAIHSYGKQIGDEVRGAVQAQGLPITPENFGAGSARQLPSFGMHTGVKTVATDDGERLRAYGCVMGKTWNDLGEGELGRLYCLVDPAKFLAYDGTHTFAHSKTIPDGDPFCEFCVREATPEELRDFEACAPEWVDADQCHPGGKPESERST